VVHILGGFAIGGALIFFDLEPYIAGALGVALFAGWEIFEVLAKIHEHGANRVSDIFVDYLGFFAAQLYTYALGYEMYWYIPTAVAVIALALETWGFLDRTGRL
jgi:hypothetical protein